MGGVEVRRRRSNWLKNGIRLVHELRLSVSGVTRFKRKTGLLGGPSVGRASVRAREDLPGVKALAAGAAGVEDQLLATARRRAGELVVRCEDLRQHVPAP